MNVFNFIGAILPELFGKIGYDINIRVYTDK